METGCISIVFTGFHSPTTASAPIAFEQVIIGPDPDQFGCGFHPHIVHDPKVKGSPCVQLLPFFEQGIIGIDQKGVVKLLAKFLLQGTQAGEVHHKTARVKLMSGELQPKTPAVPVHKAAVSGMVPLAMTAGISLEHFAAGVGAGRWKHVAGSMIG